jgi:hypothetical protein
MRRFVIIRRRFPTAGRRSQQLLLYLTISFSLPSYFDLKMEEGAATILVGGGVTISTEQNAEEQSFVAFIPIDEQKAAAARWTTLVLMYCYNHPYQPILLILIIARVIQLLITSFAARRTTEMYTATHGNAKEERMLHSRLLNEPLPNDLELEETIEDKSKHKVIEDIINRDIQKIPAPSKHVSSVDHSNNNSSVESRNVKVEERQQVLEHLHIANPWATNSATCSSETAAVVSSAAIPPETTLGNTDQHPGLDAFYHWFDVEASLFRVYERNRTDYEVTPPYNPSSRRGTVQIALQVVNRTSHTRLTAFWVNYQGKLVDKGSFGAGQMWEQTTWVDHPWVFCNDRGTALLHYIPYRVVPTTSQEPTTDPDNPSRGMHRFLIKDPRSDDSVFRCQIEDSNMPFPAAGHFPSPEFALDKTLLHCYRMNYNSWPTLIKYLSKIVQHPEVWKYRQIRAANKRFASDIWMTPAKGLLLAVGFVEQGAYVELGPTSGTLSRERVQDVARLLYHLEQWQIYSESGALPEQPEGADGYGRAGYGRAAR